MRLILARHGETAENRKRIIQSLDKAELSALGVRQATALGEYLSHEKIDVIICSPAKRTMQTLQHVKEKVKAPINIEPLIVEKDTGVWIGKPVAEMRAFREASGIPKHEFKPEGGESWSDVRKRAEKFWNKIKRKHENKTVLIVGHSLFNTIFMGFLLNKPLEWDSGIEPNCSINEIVIEKDRARVVRMAFDSYLKSLASPATNTI